MVVHYHLRPGGVRRIIELALPHIISTAPVRLESITLAAGEIPDAGWLEGLERSCVALNFAFLQAGLSISRRATIVTRTGSPADTFRFEDRDERILAKKRADLGP